MKSLLCFVLLMTLGSSQSYSQNYTSMVVDNARWIYNGYGDLNDDRFGYEIQGDSVVNNIVYKKVYHLDLESGHYTDPVVVINKSVIALLREDNIERKVYCITWGQWTSLAFHDYCEEQQDENEFLLYDFSIEVGDTLNTCLGVFEDGTIIQQITVLDIYNEIYFGYPLSTRLCESDAHLIDGIGYELGLFQHAVKFVHAGKGYFLSTYCREEDVNDCLSSSTLLVAFQHTTIYPNPTSDKVSIKTNNEFNRITIYDSMGSRLMEQKLNETKEISISIKDLKNGIHFMEIMDHEGNATIKRIVKTN